MGGGNGYLVLKDRQDPPSVPTSVLAVEAPVSMRRCPTPHLANRKGDCLGPTICRRGEEFDLRFGGVIVFDKRDLSEPAVPDMDELIALITDSSPS